MRFSAPVFRLKRRACQLSRDESIPLHRALNQVARAERAGSWSALTARLAADRPAPRIIRQLRTGDLLLLVARPGQGKTMLALELLLEATMRGQMTCFFTLDWIAPEAQVRQRKTQNPCDTTTSRTSCTGLPLASSRLWPTN